MELGLTFPLQRFLKRRPPPCGTEPDRRFCWDLHVIALRGETVSPGRPLPQPVRLRPL